MNPRHEQIFLTTEQAEMCIKFWATHKFDTAHIADFLRVKEHAVSRCIHLARGMQAEMRGAR